VNAFFHGVSFGLAVANPRCTASQAPLDGVRVQRAEGASHLPKVEKRRLCQKISWLTNFVEAAEARAGPLLKGACMIG
jgi:hypothetical protein